LSESSQNHRLLVHELTTEDGRYIVNKLVDVLYVTLFNIRATITPKNAVRYFCEFVIWRKMRTLSWLVRATPEGCYLQNSLCLKSQRKHERIKTVVMMMMRLVMVI
jgi:hypothetical protein